MQMVSSPALIAGLPPLSAMVCVGPPLLASPPGSSSGFVLQNEVPVGGAQLKPHVVLSSMLCPPSGQCRPCGGKVKGRRHHPAQLAYNCARLAAGAGG